LYNFQQDWLERRDLFVETTVFQFQKLVVTFYKQVLCTFSRKDSLFLFIGQDKDLFVGTFTNPKDSFPLLELQQNLCVLSAAKNQKENISYCREISQVLCWYCKVYFQQERFNFPVGWPA
jgi:hypothetical protein